MNKSEYEFLNSGQICTWDFMLKVFEADNKYINIFFMSKYTERIISRIPTS